MKKSVAKILACFLTVTVIVMGLTVSAFAGATTGTYKGQIPIGVYNVYCTLTIDSSSATATAELPEFGFVTLGVSIKGQYRSSTTGSVLTATDGNRNEWYNVSASIGNNGGTWTDVSATYSANGGGYSGSTVLP